MNTNNQIKTNFDSRVIITFMLVFIFSCVLLAFKKSNEVDCSIFDFTINSDHYVVDDLITFTQDSEKAYSYRWYFGDGTAISYKSKVVHSFTKPGSYKIKLLVNETCEIEKTINVLPKPIEVVKEKLIIDFEAPSRATKGEIVAFNDNTIGAESWEWTFGETNKIDSKLKNPKYTFKTIGVKTISLVINGDKSNGVSRDIVVVANAEKPNKNTITNTKKPKPTTKDVNMDTVTKVTNEEKPLPVIVKAINEAELENLLYAISDNKISLINFKNQFCEDNAPRVKVNSESKFMTLDQFYKLIKNKGIKVKGVKIYKEKDKCIETIYVNFRYK